MFTIKIDQRVFEQHPSFRRAVLVASQLHNRGPDADLEAQLRRACEEAAQKPIDLSTDQRISVWTDAFRTFTNPRQFPPAHLALLKRVQRPGATLPFISKVVAAMNTQSIAGVLPVGGDDLIRVAEFGNVLELRPAVGDERFVPLGHPDEEEGPQPGEIILVVGGIVCCRRWCWRNSHTSRIAEETNTLVMNCDGLGLDSEAKAISARDRLAQLLAQHCQATITTGLLSPASPEIQVPVVPPRGPSEPTQGW